MKKYFLIITGILTALGLIYGSTLLQTIPFLAILFLAYRDEKHWGFGLAFLLILVNLMLLSYWDVFYWAYTMYYFVSLKECCGKCK